MPQGPAIRFLVALAVLNGAVCVVGPLVVLLGPQGSYAGAGVLHALAVAALVVAPLQALALWVVLGRRLRDQLEARRTRRRVGDVLEQESLQIAFQPIVALPSRTVVGVEALSRFPLPDDVTPDVWFADAERAGRGLELELLAIRTAARRAAVLPSDVYVAVNVSPATLVRPALLETRLTCGLPPQRLVVEITEQTAVADYAPLRAVRARLRALGIRVAVDDAGAGYASLRHIVALAPDVIKLDRALVTGVDRDPARQAMVEAVVMFALQSGSTVVAEGVERRRELERLAALGVVAAQGFYTGRPTTDELTWRSWAGGSCVPAVALAQPAALS